MTTLENRFEDSWVRSTLTYTCRESGAGGALFYWFDDCSSNLKTTDQILIGHEFLTEYSRSLEQYDPLSVKNLTKRRLEVALLSDLGSTHSDVDIDSYCRGLERYNIFDTMDLLLWHEGQPFAGIGLTQTERAGFRFSASCAKFKRLHCYLEQSLKHHPHVRSSLQRQRMIACGLTVRERQVALLLNGGASNDEIAIAMCVTVGTVKTYLSRMFERIGVSSRASLSALITSMAEV